MLVKLFSSLLITLILVAPLSQKTFANAQINEAQQEMIFGTQDRWNSFLIKYGLAQEAVSTATTNEDLMKAQLNLRHSFEQLIQEPLTIVLQESSPKEQLIELLQTIHLKLGELTEQSPIQWEIFLRSNSIIGDVKENINVIPLPSTPETTIAPLPMPIEPDSEVEVETMPFEHENDLIYSQDLLNNENDCSSVLIIFAKIGWVAVFLSFIALVGFLITGGKKEA